jgi:putative flippase GtrA
MALLCQFLRFGTVGFIGFLFDNATVYGLRGWVGLYAAGALSYLVAATVTWGLNRLWTFRGVGTGPAHRQWALFLATNAVGFALNRGTYFLLIWQSPLCRQNPVLAILAGTAMGMFLNFHFSRKIVFR